MVILKDYLKENNISINAIEVDIPHELDHMDDAFEKHVG